MAQSRISHHLKLFLSLVDNSDKLQHCFLFLCYSLMDREVALLAEMDKVKAEASE